MKTGALTISTVAKQSQVNLETIRYYEREGLVPEPPRSESGYRHYPPDTVRRVRFIKRAQELGFSLKEIKELLTLRLSPDATSGEVKKRAQEKIQQIEDKIQTLNAMKNALDRLHDACSGQGPASDCPILESLDPEGFINQRRFNHECQT